MSSVILYVAIVAIWAFVLVPRWLRRHHAQPRSVPDGDVASDAAAETHEGAKDGAVGYADYPADEAQPDIHAVPVGRPATMTARSLPRSRMLQARRRLLTMLVLLTAAAGAAMAARLIPLWTCVAPAGVLVCYFLLLRAAARADAEHAYRVAASYAHQARIQAAARRRAAAAAAAPDAQIIDISSRVGDQLYDQYADATVRAVGD
ncbi:MAG: divisome protein SepX/GlpR [Streptosporangiaceae bacterium]